MNVITPMPKWRSWIQALIFSVSRVFPDTLKGLLGLRLIHFARWVIIREGDWPDLGQGRQSLGYDYMLFCSNFNGTWDQYIDAFSDGIPDGLDLFWYASLKYPQSIPVNPFKSYITYNQVDTDYYYNATPGVAQRDIKAALGVLGEIRALAGLHAAMEPAAFAAAYRAMLLKLQNSLGSHGLAPTASLDTERAECIRLGLALPNPAALGVV